MVALHYFYDPLCGWCYGALDIIHAAALIKDIPFVMHAGGMMQKQPVTAAMQQFIMEHDKRIKLETGQIFGNGYTEGLLHNATAWFDSYLPIRAILVAELMGIAPLIMLDQIQKAHYLQGREIAQINVLADIAELQGLIRYTFIEKLNQSVEEMELHIKISRQLMVLHGFSGFPTLALENNGQWFSINVRDFFRKAEKIIPYIQSIISNKDRDEVELSKQFCSLDGCV
ncbi:DsbA family protein [Zooshikella harenae]|uniref:DsbA family protein n=1 Tax=Zooshikella harenae TaxID=2827238 RepID=A0ABS5ZG80_9GAMM|nr:DsbA family protein [Zooshikella harenae]MBU2712873.1 DsbA family protein [Zooshikella harenae]